MKKLIPLFLFLPALVFAQGGAGTYIASGCQIELSNKILQFYRANDTTATGLVATDTTDSEGRWDVNLPGTGNYRIYSSSDNLWLDRFSWLAWDSLGSHFETYATDSSGIRGAVRLHPAIRNGRTSLYFMKNSNANDNDDSALAQITAGGYVTGDSDLAFYTADTGIGGLRPRMEIQVYALNPLVTWGEDSPGGGRQIGSFRIRSTSGIKLEKRTDGSGNEQTYVAPSAGGFAFRNAANDNEYMALSKDGSNNIYLGGTGIPKVFLNPKGVPGAYWDTSGLYLDSGDIKILGSQKAMVVPGDGSYRMTVSDTERNLLSQAGNALYIAGTGLTNILMFPGGVEKSRFSSNGLEVVTGANAQTDTVSIAAAGDSVRVVNTLLTANSWVLLTAMPNATAPTGHYYISNMVEDTMTIKSTVDESVDKKVLYYIAKF